MILFFGPAGAGKSMQGQLLAARHGWQWLSTGNMLRASKDPEITGRISAGNLVSDEQMNLVVEEALTVQKEASNVILDGYPRNVTQAEWLVAKQAAGEISIDMAIVLEVSRQEIVDRLQARGRSDDTPEVIDIRLGIYRKEIYPILDFINSKNIPIVHISGVGTVGQVHDLVESELVGRGITKEV